MKRQSTEAGDPSHIRFLALLQVSAISVMSKRRNIIKCHGMFSNADPPCKSLQASKFLDDVTLLNFYIGLFQEVEQSVAYFVLKLKRVSSCILHTTKLMDKQTKSDSHTKRQKTDEIRFTSLARPLSRIDFYLAALKCLFRLNDDMHLITFMCRWHKLCNHRTSETSSFDAKNTSWRSLAKWEKLCAVQLVLVQVHLLGVYCSFRCNSNSADNMCQHSNKTRLGRFQHWGWACVMLTQKCTMN